ncbi:MAG TPA: hypothetical protein VIK53_00665 [Verrucomicrobiae bacterium]
MKQLNGCAAKVHIGDKGTDGRIYPVGVSPREMGGPNWCGFFNLILRLRCF